MTGAALVLEACLLFGLTPGAWWALSPDDQLVMQAHTLNKLRDGYNGKPRMNFTKQRIPDSEVGAAVVADLERLRQEGTLNTDEERAMKRSEAAGVTPTSRARVEAATQAALDILSAHGEL